jgi:hypothetical protein
MIGTCEFCGEPNVKLVAKLKADPDQKVCATCAKDPRIPTEWIITLKQRAHFVQ